MFCTAIVWQKYIYFLNYSKIIQNIGQDSIYVQKIFVITFILYLYAHKKQKKILKKDW